MRWSLADGSVEALKWIAFAAMVFDHVDVVLLDRGAPWLMYVGRLAMPIFAIVFGFNLARARDPIATIKRLALVGLAVQPIVWVTINRGQVLPLNILLTFAAGGLVAHLVRRDQVLPAIAVLAITSLFVDYFVAGVLLVASSSLYVWTRGPAALAGMAIAIAALCLVNGNAWALAGVALVWSARWWPSIDVPRWRWAFLVLYPAHLVALGAMAAAR